MTVHAVDVAGDGVRSADPLGGWHRPVTVRAVAVVRAADPRGGWDGG